MRPKSSRIGIDQENLLSSLKAIVNAVDVLRATNEKLEKMLVEDKQLRQDNEASMPLTTCEKKGADNLMKQYGTTEKCVKCGFWGIRASTTWISAETGKEKGEHLVRQCAVCGYSWCERPLDCATDEERK